MSDGASLSGTVARFAAGLSFDAIPRALVEKSKWHILDTIGVGLAGARSEEVARTVAALGRGGAGPAPVWGTSILASPRDAALINGIGCHAYELDDTEGCDHSGAVVVPAVLSAASLAKRTIGGRDLITAIVLGYEIARRVMESCGGYAAHNGRGWHSTATCGPFGAAAAAGHILGFGEAEHRAALGIAASCAGGTWAFIHDGAQTKRFHTGRAAEGGMLAAMLAAEGMRGPGAIFEDGWGGFFRSIAPETCRPDRMVEGLGESWVFARAALKPYPSCRGTHCAIDALDTMLREASAGLDDVTRIEVTLALLLLDMCGGRDVSTLPAAQMSLPFALAARLAHGRGAPALEHYRSDRRGEARIADAMDRIVMRGDPGMVSEVQSCVRVRFANGATAECMPPVPKGDSAAPLGDDEIVAKFRQLAEMVCPLARATTIMERILDLDRLADIADLHVSLAGTYRPDLKTVFG